MNDWKNGKRWKAAVINLGCKVNKYESDSMKDKLSDEGFEIVEPEEMADIYIVNTCSVTNMAQKKSRQMLRRAKKRNPEAVIAAAGCYVNADCDGLKGEEFVDIVVGNNCKKDIVQVIKDYMEERESGSIRQSGGRTKGELYVDIGKTREYEEMGSLGAAHLDHQRAYIKIQDGCNQFCSYCIIPYTRGRVRSRKPEQILAEIQHLAGKGVKEFVLTGIHISSYGVDFAGQGEEYDRRIDGKKAEVGKKQEESGAAEGGEIADLGVLVERIAKIPEVKRIRLGSLEPRIVTGDFLRRISGTDKLCPHFHLSLQSACDATLKRMNRKYTVEEFKEKCEMLREYFEKPAITTDVIVGFPGETEEEFAITLKNLQELNLYEIHVFKYSVRAGTAAERFTGQVAEEEKGKRSEVLLKLTEKQRKAYERSLQGVPDEILVEEELAAAKLEEAPPEDAVWVRGISVNGAPADVEASGKVRYFTGHTKRYVKVNIAAKGSLINQIVQVEL
ncbi:MAG: MiaB/RimO family radical SAM methylthiotransferase [Bacteroidales bacterium]|nr:MiaB/RimO family radical SAM methylthiotransferase [Clostridium sp.]MCM1202587.1 MiaB/RimO family radical SAM methylthiotransferase [Bacteroidales bacterium]